jgi:2-polyprenyl-6-methoxyphenol hydroxylase-like FAD-dependent oxidoreductase
MRFGHVVVIGAGMAGLVAARVLADRAEQVTVLERDRLPERPEARKGVPQGRHLHGLLVRGHDIVTELLPGLDAALDASGAVRVDWIGDVKLVSQYGPFPRYPSALHGHTMSRPLLEELVREFVAAWPRISFRTGCEAVSLIPARGPLVGVAGVRYRVRGEGDAEVELLADLVVDAAGRDSKLTAWLADLGFGGMPETTVDAHVGYATRLFTPPPDTDPGWAYLLARDPLPGTRAGAIYPVEGGRWLVTLVGFGGDYPPTDDAGFLDFARSVTTPELGELVAAASPESPVMGFRSTANRMRHVERMQAWPRGLIALGDSICTFNPVYGQGMSVAAGGAELLADALARYPRRGFERTFQVQLARLLRDPWLMSTGEDYRYPGTDGPRRTVATRIGQWYADQVMRAAVHDERVHRAFIDVIHMLRRPGSLARPDLVARIVRTRLRRRDQAAGS